MMVLTKIGTTSAAAMIPATSRLFGAAPRWTAMIEDARAIAPTPIEPTAITIESFPRAPRPSRSARSAALQPRRRYRMRLGVGLCVAGHGGQELLAVEGVQP